MDSDGFQRNSGIPVNSCGIRQNSRIPADSGGICGGLKSIGHSPRLRKIHAYTGRAHCDEEKRDSRREARHSQISRSQQGSSYASAIMKARGLVILNGAVI